MPIIGTITDDQGRFRDNAAVVRAHAFPFRDDVTTEDVSGALNHFVSDGKLYRYKVDGESYLQDVTVWETQHPQWAAVSKYPAPEGSTGRIRTRQNNAYVEADWDTAGGFGVQVNTSPEEHARTLGLNRRTRTRTRTRNSQEQRTHLAQVRAPRLGAMESDIEDAELIEIDATTGEVAEEPSISRLAASTRDLSRRFAEHAKDAPSGSAG